MNSTKKWYESKTIWVGILEVIAGVASALAGQIQLGAPLTIVGILKIVLRIVSDKAVTQ